MLNWFVFNRSLYNQAVAAAGSIDTGSTRSPFGHIMVAVPGGDLLLIYQQGTNGLCYRRSVNGGTVWGPELVISPRVDVYASAIINPTTLDVHVVYSGHGDPGTGDLGVYYRPLIWDSGDDEWDVGGEQTLAGGGSLYDSATAGRHNATISVGDDGYPVITYLRNASGIITWAMLVSQEVWAFTDFDVDLNIGVTADEDSRGATVQTDSRSVYFVSRTGSWYSLASATSLTNPVAATGIDLTVLFSWLGSESEMVAVARNDDSDRLGIVYLAGDGAPHFRLYNLETYALISDTEMDTTAADSVSITWDGAVFWMAWVESDNVRISNSNAPATVVQTFSNPGPDEDWLWLNSPVSCLYSMNIIFVWCATASSIYTGVFSPSRPITVAETGTGVDVVQIEVSEAETGTGADGTVVYDNIPVADTGTGVDTPTAGPSVADTGTGVDVGGKGSTIDETGTGTDIVQIEMSVAETGSGADGSSYYQTVPVADTGSGVDTRAVEVAPADTGVGVDAVPNIGVPVAEVGVGADTVVIELAGATESGIGADAMTAGIVIADTGTGVDAPDVTKPGAAETGTGVDSVEIAVSVAETGTGADQIGAGQAIFVNVSDTGTGVDSPSQTWVSTAVVVRLLQHSGEVRLKTES